MTGKEKLGHFEQPSGYRPASYLSRLVCRLGGCGPVVTMRAGLHLGGGPDGGPAPTLPVFSPCGCVIGHRQHLQGLFPAALEDNGNAGILCDTTAQGVTGFDFGR